MEYIAKALEFYNYFKGAIDPLVGILFGAMLTYFITFGQVKNSNKFVVLKEIKQELMLSMDYLHKNINLINMKSNEFYKSINSKDYIKSSNILDELLFIYNEISQTKNSLISNYELLNSVFDVYNGKTELSNIIKRTDDYLKCFYEKVYLKMDIPAFKQENFVNSKAYEDAITNFRLALNDASFREHFVGLADCHVGKVVETINCQLAKLVK